MIDNALRGRSGFQGRTAAFLAGELPAVEDEGMGAMKQISVWVREEDLAMADKLLPRLEAAGLVMGKVTKSDVLRFAVARGLVVLETVLPQVSEGQSTSVQHPKGSGDAQPQLKEKRPPPVAIRRRKRPPLS